MNNIPTLSETQIAILKSAVVGNAGHLKTFPDNLKGGARNKVLTALLNKGLVRQEGDEFFATEAGYQAIGCTSEPYEPGPAVAEAYLADTGELAHSANHSRIRSGTKQALVIEMLHRPEGATIAQIQEATGWQAHTVRGTFAAAFKKRLGLAISSDKAEGGERVYRIV
jgi:hypothetical protein